jgi:DNA-binding response OmpR family regulator
MSEILVVEDEVNTSNLLRRYFEIIGYEVATAYDGASAIALAEEHKPAVIILDIMLPDVDGYEVCKRLRTNPTTDCIPIIFLTQKDERRDRLEGLGLGADDYLTKPFDVEELRLRVHNIISKTGGAAMVDLRTSLPGVELIKEHLPSLLDNADNVFIDVGINHYDQFARRYGPVAANRMLRAVAKLISDLLHEIDPAHPFIGHPQDKHFLVATQRQSAERFESELPTRFGRQVGQYYDYEDQSRGQMMLDGEQVPFMSFRLMRIEPSTLRALALYDK